MDELFNSQNYVTNTYVDEDGNDCESNEYFFLDDLYNDRLDEVKNLFNENMTASIFKIDRLSSRWNGKSETVEYISNTDIDKLLQKFCDADDIVIKSDKRFKNWKFDMYHHDGCNTYNISEVHIGQSKDYLYSIALNILKDELKDELKDNTPVTKEEFKKKAVEKN